MELSKLSIARAAAEFAVITLGVLVALGVESWRDDVAERAFEREFLAHIKSEVWLRFPNKKLRMRRTV